jgi:hypothetical protein
MVPFDSKNRSKLPRDRERLDRREGADPGNSYIKDRQLRGGSLLHPRLYIYSNRIIKMLYKLNISGTTTCPRIVNLHLQAQDASNCIIKTTIKYNKQKKKKNKDLKKTIIPP